MKRWKPRGSDWLDDRRGPTRWVDNRMATVQIQGRECLAMTGDISPGGIQLALVGDMAEPAADVAVEVAFEHEVVALRGQVVYTAPRAWGHIVGVSLSRRQDAVRDFLLQRYECSPEAVEQGVCPLLR